MIESEIGQENDFFRKKIALIGMVTNIKKPVILDIVFDYTSTAIEHDEVAARKGAGKNGGKTQR